MTNWEYIAQYLGILLSGVLAFKLLGLRLSPVYRSFSIFLILDLAGSLMWACWWFLGRRFWGADYRAIWAIDHILTGVASIFTIYALLTAVLEKLPGILKLSRRVLNGSFVVATLLAALSARLEYDFSGYSAFSGMDKLFYGELIVDRAVSTVVFLVLVSILLFLYWFPVTPTRNLSVFVVGFAVYSLGNITLLLVQSLWLHQASRKANLFVQLLSCLCFAYWAVFISPAGENVRTPLNNRFSPSERDRLLHRLDLINESLLRPVQR